MVPSMRLKYCAWLLGILCLVVLSLSPAARSQDSSELNVNINQVVLQEGDLAGLQLQNASTVNALWPLVKNLPDYMRQPENPPPDIENINIDSSFVIVEDYSDGLLQNWSSYDNTIWAKIEYGYYINPQHARDAICYIVYNRNLPEFYNYWFWNDYYYNYHQVPNCRKLNYGDLSYYVTPLEGGGGFIFMVKSHFIFMIDSLQQSVEDQIIQVLLSKVP
jgi:hypothetical protein